ncbi:MAG: hypothetical protein IT223_00370 [Crocinitomicaceae bacterium]|nr:hypothetical protein [Crocinitomicaceae bacterium]
MKKSLCFSILLACLFSLNAEAQSGHTLVFNQALLIESTPTTLAAGKIWKIENILPSTNVIATVPNPVGNNSTQVATSECIIWVNGNSIRAISSKATSNNSYSDLSARPLSTSVAVHSIFDSPIWLPEGTVLAAGSNVQYISVLEFLVE